MIKNKENKKNHTEIFIDKEIMFKTAIKIGSCMLNGSAGVQLEKGLHLLKGKWCPSPLAGYTGHFLVVH